MKPGDLMRAYMEALVRVSADLHEAHKAARALGREDLCQLLRKAQWQVVAAMAECVPDQKPPEVLS